MGAWTRVVAGSVGLVAFWMGSAVAQGSSPDWVAVLKGVDGVIVYCRAAKPRDYSQDMCGKLSQAAVAAFDGSNLKAVHTGIAYTGVDVKPDDLTDETTLKTAAGITSPLVLRLLITGTDGANPGVTIGITASRPFRSAIEEGTGGPGLAGDLVVYDQQWIADGPRRKVIAVLTEFGSKKLREIAADMRATR